MNKETQKKLNEYTGLIHEYNLKKNITGFKSYEEIYDKLVMTSVRDLDKYGVPRGTSVADLGTGNGVPGIVLGILHPHLEFLLIDSNGKKCEFVQGVIDSMKLQNIKVENKRTEDAASEYRDRFGMVVSRAFGPIGYSLEFGLVMLKEGGHLYIYSHRGYDDLSKELLDFAQKLGGERDISLYEEGIALKKVSPTPETYPRKFPAIKRDGKRIPEFRD